MSDEAQCPVNGGPANGGAESGKMDGAAVLFEMTNRTWWPNAARHLGAAPEPARAATRWTRDFDYAAEFATLDLAAVKADITALMTDSQEWWPADFGHYGPLFIRMAWHARRHVPHR